MSQEFILVLGCLFQGSGSGGGGAGEGTLDCKCWGTLLTRSSGALWQQGEKEGELAVTSPSPLLSPTPISPVTPGEFARSLVLGLIGQLHDDVILLQLPESFSLLFSCAN